MAVFFSDTPANLDYCPVEWFRGLVITSPCVMVCSSANHRDNAGVVISQRRTQYLYGLFVEQLSCRIVAGVLVKLRQGREAFSEVRMRLSKCLTIDADRLVQSQEGLRILSGALIKQGQRV